MQQLIQPTLPGKGIVGECLVYARSLYGIGPKYLTALKGWQGAQYKSSGSPPTDVSVPLWFSWKTDGHVVVQVPGKGLYSSPMKAGENYHIFSSIASVESYLGAKYLGWSEDINDVRVVTEGDNMAAATEYDVNIIDYYVAGNNGYDTHPNSLNGENATFLKQFIGQETQTVLRHFYQVSGGDWKTRLDGLYARLATQEQQIKDLTASGSSKFVPVDGQVYKKSGESL